MVLVDLTETAQTSDEITLNVETVTGEKGETPFDGPFEVGDDWWYGEDEGKCDLPVYSSDAAQELYAYMNDYISGQNSGVYFIHQTKVYKKGGEPNIRRHNDPDPPNNVYDYYLYSASTEYGTVTDEVLCVEYNEMNAYYNYLEYLLFTKIPDEEMPAGYVVEIIVWMIGYYEQNGPHTHYYHEGEFKYGYPIGYDEGEGPEEL